MGKHKIATPDYPPIICLFYKQIPSDTPSIFQELTTPAEYFIFNKQKTSAGEEEAPCHQRQSRSPVRTD